MAGADTALPVCVRLAKRLPPRGVHSCGGWVPSTVPDEWSPRVCRPSVCCSDCRLRWAGSPLPPWSAVWLDHGGGACQQALPSARRRGGGRRRVAASGTSGALREDGEKPRGCGGVGWGSVSPQSPRRPRPPPRAAVGGGPRRPGRNLGSAGPRLTAPQKIGRAHV